MTMTQTTQQFLLTHETNKHKEDSVISGLRNIKTDFYYFAQGSTIPFFCRRIGDNVSNYWSGGARVKRSIKEFANLKYTKVGISRPIETHVLRNDKMLASFEFFTDAYDFFERRMKDDVTLPTFMTADRKITYVLRTPDWGNLIVDTLCFDDKLNYLTTVREEPEIYCKAENGKNYSSCWGGDCY